MRSLSVLVVGLLLLVACRVARIEPFGEAKLDSLCLDTKRCEARGDNIVNLLSKKSAPRLYLAPEKGPEQLLGKVAPKRDAQSVMKTCGAEIAAADWLAAPESIRQFPLGDQGKNDLRLRLRAYLSARTGALAIPDEQSVEASLSAVISALALDRVSWVSQTYWLSDAAFERRVGQCGEEERKNIIYSITVLAPSQAFQADLANKLARALQDTLHKPDAGAADAGADAGAEPPASDEAALATEPAPEASSAAAAGDEADAGPPSTEMLAHDVVRALARDTRVVAALGFDDP